MGLRYAMSAGFGLLLGLVPVPGDSAEHQPGSGASGGGQTGRFVGAKPTVYPDWFKQSFLDFNDDIAEAASDGKRVMIMFHQDGCPYCNALVERNLSQKDIEQLMRTKFDTIAVNMWGDRDVATVDGKIYTEKSFAAALKVQFTPTLLFLTENGDVALRLNGYLPPQRFKLALDYVVGKHERKINFRDYAKQNAAIPTSGDLNQKEFFVRPPYDLSRTEDRPLAVFFEQRQCPNCDLLHRNTLTDVDTLRILNQFVNVQLDMWSDTPLVTPAGERTTARAWAGKLNVQYAPSIVLFSPDGHEVIRSEAWFKGFHTQSIFDYVLSAAYRQQPSFQRYISHRADRIREQGRDVDIWR